MEMGKGKTSPTRHIFHKSIEIYYTQHMQHREGSQHPMDTHTQPGPLACLSAKIFVYCVYYADSEPPPQRLLLLLYNNLQSILRFASPAICISRKVSS